MTEYEEQVQAGVKAATRCLKAKFADAAIDVEAEIGGAYKFHLRSPSRASQRLQLPEHLLADHRTEDAMLDALAGRSVLNRLHAGETEVVVW